MTDIKVPRELLERVISKMNIVWQKTDEIEEIKALLAQPAAPTDGEVYRRKSSGDALLAAQAKCDAPADARCEHCDGTGDVHRADGEWLGSCVCPAGKAPADGEVVEVVAQVKAELAELVAALKRIDGMVYDPWTNGATAGEIAHAALAKHRGE